MRPCTSDPPQALADVGLVPPGTVWKVLKAIYGLRIAPKAWDAERDREEAAKLLAAKLKAEEEERLRLSVYG